MNKEIVEELKPRKEEPEPRRTGTEKTGAKKSAKSRRRVRWAILAAGAVLIAAAGYLLLLRGRGAQTGAIAREDTTVLAYADMDNSVRATGTVESGDVHKVYSTLNYAVEEVLVQVGDGVKAGDLLCTLDSGALEDQIRLRETAMGISAESAAQQVKAARDSYNAAKDALDNGENASLISAKSNMQNAHDNWQRAKKTYDDYLDTLDDGYNATLIAQDSAVNAARSALDSAESACAAAETAADAAKDALDQHVVDPSGNQAAADAAETVLEGALLARQMKQDALDSALAAYQAAQAAYTSIASPTEGERQALADAKAAYEAADTDLAAARRETADAQANFEDAQSRLTAGVDSAHQALLAEYAAKKAALDAAEAARNSAQGNYDSAVRSRKAAYKSADSALESYADTEDSAYASYKTARDSYQAAVKSAETSLQSGKNSLTSAEIGAKNDSAVLELAQLQENLDATKIYAEADGTVTAVYAEEGSSGSGLLFVIEDLNRLIVETTVKEYDVQTVAVGMPVTIRSEAAGGETYDGTVLSIAPTSGKNARGETDITGDIVFAAKVGVTSQDTKLRVGMSVRLNYILNRQSGVLSVPYDAVYQNAAGQPCVLILELESGETYTVRERAVTTGLENDLSIAVGGEGIAPGLRVVNDAENYAALIDRTVRLGAQAQAPAAGIFVRNGGGMG